MIDLHADFGSTVEVPAAVVFLHPTHNVALVQYEPSRLGGGAVATAELSSDIEIHLS